MCACGTPAAQPTLLHTSCLHILDHHQTRLDSSTRPDQTHSPPSILLLKTLQDDQPRRQPLGYLFIFFTSTQGHEPPHYIGQRRPHLLTPITHRAPTPHDPCLYTCIPSPPSRRDYVHDDSNACPPPLGMARAAERLSFSLLSPISHCHLISSSVTYRDWPTNQEAAENQFHKLHLHRVRAITVWLSLRP